MVKITKYYINVSYFLPESISVIYQNFYDSSWQPSFPSSLCKSWPTIERLTKDRQIYNYFISCRSISLSGQYPQDSTIFPSSTLKFSNASKLIALPDYGQYNFVIATYLRLKFCTKIISLLLAFMLSQMYHWRSIRSRTSGQIIGIKLVFALTLLPYALTA